MQSSALRVSRPWVHAQALIVLTSHSAPTYPLPSGPEAFLKLRLCPYFLSDPWNTYSWAKLISSGSWCFCWMYNLTSVTAHLPDDHWAELVTAINPAWSCGTAPVLKSLPLSVPGSPVAHPPMCRSLGPDAPWQSVPVVAPLQLMAGAVQGVITLQRWRGVWVVGLSLLPTESFRTVLYKATFLTMWLS